MKILSDSGGEFRFGDEAYFARVEALLQDARLGPLLDKLEGHLRKGGAETVVRAPLRMVVGTACLFYLGGRQLAEEPPDALHQLAEFAEPLEHMIKILSGRGIGDVLVALGAPATLGTLNSDEQALRAAMGRFEAGLDFLDALYHALPHPVKKPPYRPAKNGDLRELVDELASYWERTTGVRFSPKWDRTGRQLQAATNAAAFVFEVVCYVDPDALPSLPKRAEAAARRLRNSRK